MLNYTTLDVKRQLIVFPLMGLPWPYLCIGDKSLIDSLKDFLGYGVKRPKDSETEWGKVEVVGKVSLSMLGTLCLINLREGLNSLPRARAGGRHENQVSAKMSITVLRKQENVCMPRQA